MRRLPKIKFKFNLLRKLRKVNYKSIIKKIFSGTSLLIIVIILGAVSIFLSQKFYLRKDVTDQSIYSLTRSTKDILNKLEKDITIKVYFSENIPAEFTSVKQNSIDLLQEYVNLSNNKISLEIKNPTDASFSSDALTDGIRQIQFSELSDDSFSVAQGFFGLAIKSGDFTETIPVIASDGNLEYELTSRISKSLNKQEKTIGFLTGHGEKSNVVDFSQANDLIQSEYKTTTVDLTSGQPINPEEVSVLVIASPTQKLSERAIFEIEQYSLKGGAVLVLSDILQLQQDTPFLNANEGNINDLLKIYGLEQEKKVILDESFTPIISSMTRIQYPYWVLVTPEGLNTEIPALNGLSSATLLWSNPLKKKDDTQLKFTEIITSSNKAWVEEGDSINIDFKEFTPGEQAKYVLGYLVEGKLTKSFKEVPKVEGEDKRTAEVEIKETNDNIRFVAIGDVDFITDSFHNSNEQNLPLFINTIDWLSNSKGLSEIRSKSIAPRPLTVIEDDLKNTVKALNIAISPVIVFILGIFILTKRSKQKSKIL